MTAAHVSHATRGRARLRLPSAKGDAGFFERLEHDLRRFKSVTNVKVNAATGSVLLHHRGDLRDLTGQAQEQGVFEVVAVEPAHHHDPHEPLEALREKLFEANESIRRRTKNTADLRSVAFTALLAGSMYQLFRGNFLPAGGTMLMQALDVLLGFKRRDE